MKRSTVLSRSARCAASLILLAGCEPWSVPTSGAEKGADAPAVATPAEPAAVDSQRDFVVCMAACAEGQKLDVDDRATCRLACEAKVGAEPVVESTMAKSVLLRFDTCADGCGSGSRDDRATCRLECAQRAAATVPREGFDDSQRGCAASCLEALPVCEQKCGPQPDDASTCRLHCETQVTTCLGRCESVERSKT